MIIIDKFKDALFRIVPYVEKYKNEKHIEIEFRLGFIEASPTHFNTDIPVDFFNKIKKKLNSNKNWASVQNSKTTDYFNSGVRISVDNKRTVGEAVSCIRKTKLVTINFRFEDTPFDIRFCISKEEPCVLNDVQKRIQNCNHSREKERTRFTHKFWNFDITRVKEIENTVENVTHEIELDVSWPVGETSVPLAKPRFASPDTALPYIIYSSLLKINDLVNMCENVSEKSQMVFVGAKCDEKKH
jgi:hypothetical protein